MIKLSNQISLIVAFSQLTIRYEKNILKTSFETRRKNSKPPTPNTSPLK